MITLRVLIVFSFPIKITLRKINIFFLKYQASMSADYKDAIHFLANKSSAKSAPYAFWAAAPEGTGGDEVL